MNFLQWLLFGAWFSSAIVVRAGYAASKFGGKHPILEAVLVIGGPVTLIITYFIYVVDDNY